MKTLIHKLSTAVMAGLLSISIGAALAQVPDTLIHNIPAPFGTAQFGYSVAVEGGYTVVGAPFDDLGGTDSGVVKVFDSTTGALLFLVPNPSPAVSDYFGWSVAISGTRVVVGATSDDTGATDAGSAYVYDLSSGTPTVPVATLNNPGPAVSDFFGSSVAIDGTRVVVGARLDDTGATNAGSAYVYDLSSGTPTVPVATLNNPGPATNDFFGVSVAISGTRVVVGADSDDTGATNGGSAYVYDLSSGTPTVPVATLNNPSPAADDIFGASVAISGTRVVVGAYADNTGASDAGSVYVYDLSSGTPTVPVATLNNPGPAATDAFGYSVAISGTRVVVGAIYDDTGATDAGSAYVYDLSSGTPAVPVATLNNPGPAASDVFGYSVAISGTRVVVGAVYDDTGATDAGSAYVYDLSSGTPTVPVATLNNPGPAAGDSFGTSVAISGNLMVVGAHNDDTGATNAGSVYVYDLSSGTPTVPVATLNNPSPAASDNFGWSVAISGTRVVVGALFDDTGATDAGSVYVYDLSSGTPTVPVVTLNNPSPAASDFFGTSVAISSTRVVVGAYQDDTGAINVGSAYVYDLSSGTPTVPVATLNNPSPAQSDHFGVSVAISGTRVVVGAASDDTGAPDAGSVYVYDLSSGTPTVPVATLNNPSPAASDEFGVSVAISGTRVVVAAYPDDTGATGAGSVYVYDLSSGTPTVPVATLHNPSPAADDSFGFSVAISGTRVVVGAIYDNTGGSNAGSAYVYDLSSGTPTVPVATLNNPGPAASDLFGASVAIDGTTIAIGTPNDDTVATDKGYAYVFGPGDTSTLAPTLTSPAPSTVTGNPVSVSFTLPEAALNGSVTLSFGSTVLTLANSEGSAGAHAFTFNPAAPTASAQVASGAAVVDGSYTVTLSYQDALGNPAASAVSTAVVVDTTAPTFSLPANITAEATSVEGAVVTYAASASDSGSGVATSSFVPASGSTFPLGTTTVNTSATDNAGNMATGSFTVTVVGVPGVLSFANGTPSFNPVNSSGLPNLIAVQISRVGVGNGVVTVDVVPSQPATVPSGFAKYVYGTDYEFVSGTASGTTVSFGIWELSKTVQVLLKTPVLTKKGQLKLTLTSTTGGAAIGSPAAATVTINARDTVAPTLVFNAPVVGAAFDITGTVKDAGGLASLTVKVNGATLPLTVDPVTGYVANAIAPYSVLGAIAENGANVILVTAKDLSGNTSTMTKTVTYLNNRPALTGTYTALIKPTGTPDGDTTGFLTATLTVAGKITGKVTLSGATVSFTGLLNNAGVATFSNISDTALNLIDSTEFDAYLGALAFSVSTPDGLVGVLTTRASGGTILATCAGTKTPYNSLNLVPAGLLTAATKGVYTVAFPSKEQSPVLTASAYPQGDGYATLTLTNAGVITVLGKLADGTALSASGNLRADGTLPLFATLYKKLGLVAGDITFADLANSDVSGSDLIWIRPNQRTARYYRYGWETGIRIDAVGAKYITPAALDFGQGAVEIVNGNAALVFTDGQLASTITHNVNVTPTTGAVTHIHAVGAPYKLTLTASTGVFTGTFTHGADTDKYYGVLINKGANKGGFGYFLSTVPLIYGASGESGGVSLQP